MKLSKEQADWLIKEFEIRWLGHHPLIGEVQDSLALVTLKLLLNDTEKEFPAFEQYSVEKELLFRVYLHEKEFIRISSELFWFDLNFYEFKQFADRCLKITEYIQQNA